jgi:hypothetical protein
VLWLLLQQVDKLQQQLTVQEETVNKARQQLAAEQLKVKVCPGK